MRAVLSGLMPAAAAAALTSLVAEFGWPLAPRTLAILHGVDFAVAGLFALNAIVQLADARDRRAHLRRHWPEFLLVVAFVIPFFAALGSALVRAYIVITQVYLVGAVVLGAVRANERLTSRRVRPALMLVGSFVLVIAIGTGLLLTPNARTTTWTFVDALFMSTSAACVTGLAVRDIGTELTFKGQLVILGLIQVGGLGIVTIAMFVTYLSRQSMRVHQMTAVRELLSAQSMGELGRMLTYTIALTLGVEAAGAALLYAARPDLDAGPRLWWAVFHSVSAFCNAGFSLDATSLVAHRNSIPILGTVAFLIVVGGIGFPVLLDLLRFEVGSIGSLRLARWWPTAEFGPRSRLSLHTKIVLGTTSLLLVAGAAFFYAAEANHVLAGRSGRERFLASLFQSITTRTAGFNTVDIGALQLPTLLLFVVLMAIGASPASTGGGIKTSAVATIWLAIRTMIRSRDRVEVFGRTIPRPVVDTAFSVAALYGMAVVVTTGLLLATQSHKDVGFLRVLFESVSALSTVGLTMNFTTCLNDFGRIVISCAMLVGRVGPLAILWSLMARPPAARYEYPEEPIVVS
jgi:potassium uptake TrkH family protein